MRTWAYADYSDADIQQRIATIQNAGMQCMMMLGSTGNLSWMEHVVSMLGSNCNIYEFGNEPDNSNNGTNIAQTTKRWIADIPLLRAINPHAVFGGPAVQYAESSDGTQGSYPSDIAYFLATTAAAGVRADFISYHDYPCEKATSMSQCLSNTPGDIKYNYNLVLSWENQYYGNTVPTGVSEYNFDPGTGNLFSLGRQQVLHDPVDHDRPRTHLPRMAWHSPTSSRHSITRATGIWTCSTTPPRTGRKPSTTPWRRPSPSTAARRRCHSQPPALLEPDGRAASRRVRCASREVARVTSTPLACDRVASRSGSGRRWFGLGIAPGTSSGRRDLPTERSFDDSGRRARRCVHSCPCGAEIQAGIDARFSPMHDGDLRIVISPNREWSDQCSPNFRVLGTPEKDPAVGCSMFLLAACQP